MLLIELAKEFAAKKLAYAIVGGYAVALHGAIRGTVDIDLILNFNCAEFEKAEEVFHHLGLQSKLPVSATEVFQFREEYIKNKNLIAWSFVDPTNPIRQVDVIITQNLKGLRTKKIQAYGTKISVLNINDLIAMKAQSGRQQDLLDIEALEKIKRKDV